MSPPKFITDDYFWMRDDDRKNEKVLSQLRAENFHTEASTSHLASFREELYEELKVYSVFVGCSVYSCGLLQA